MMLFTKDQRAKLLANGAASIEAEIDHWPVVKLFTPDAGATWLLTELDPEEPDRAWGLADLGTGFPEFGTVWLPEIEALRGKLGLSVERDLSFKARGPISRYIDAACRAERIVEDIG